MLPRGSSETGGNTLSATPNTPFALGRQTSAAGILREGGAKRFCDLYGTAGTEERGVIRLRPMGLEFVRILTISTETDMVCVVSVGVPACLIIRPSVICSGSPTIDYR
ncbi:MAG: hypothetical protein MRJ65_06980 [Candidatus Brocadiaceae bacterium]|nr:hypothetical protein [Candidatus Brocadiaceae bacterium]